MYLTLFRAPAFSFAVGGVILGVLAGVIIGMWEGFHGGYIEGFVASQRLGSQEAAERGAVAFLIRTMRNPECAVTSEVSGIVFQDAGDGSVLQMVHVPPLDWIGPVDMDAIVTDPDAFHFLVVPSPEDSSLGAVVVTY
ncbi:MAG: hypothetical protein NUV56_00255 [Candidatus Uhrbacteria bacterium]|nr:hypothetical protein [Candidatus Uhrbacteria bacterium]